MQYCLVSDQRKLKLDIDPDRKASATIYDNDFKFLMLGAVSRLARKDTMIPGQEKDVPIVSTPQEAGQRIGLQGEEVKDHGRYH
jgi:hypothetical protein